jgi:uncharacterized membrane protein YphA (DoxX/SURF4 family)
VPDSNPGIYVEILIHQPLERIWQLTQDPSLHQRWDLRFTRIEYLPRASSSEPQEFLYETRIGFGLAIRGTGESIGERILEAGDATSSLKFASDDPKSLIREGSGYWRYVPTESGLRFFTWYDYQVRFGILGRFLDRLAFRPLIGWATAWSFDRLRLWAEDDQSPESSMSYAFIHAVARLAIAFIWIWHGLVPKLIYHHIDERTMLAQAGLPLHLLPWIGLLEIIFGLAVLATWKRRSVFPANILFMLIATVVVATRSPAYLSAAFNPVTLNLAAIALSIIGWIAAKYVPSARHCLRKPPRGTA